MKSKINFKIISISLAVLNAILLTILLILFTSIFVEEKGNPHAIIKTTMGDIKIELYPNEAPITVDNFIKYAEDGFYEGLVFHRVIDGFMIQGGGFTPNGEQRQTRDSIVLESNNGLSNDRGTIAMARTMVPDSATSQFFINVDDNLFLNYQNEQNPGYAVFGKVVEGMDVVDKIRVVRTANREFHENWPVDNIVIEEVIIVK